MAQPSWHEAARKEQQDNSIMGTNNSSIVSKRSVERLYYAEPHFFRYFVKKPQRRSPIINRGYWLRMYAVEHVVRQFIEEPSERQKIVINLGCGYDPLPFQWLAKAPETCEHTTFVDVDYRQLIDKKCETIYSTQQLHNLLGHIEASKSVEAVRLRSDNYLAIGCDLGDTSKLDEALRNELDLANCLVLCIAEVSVTYMDVQAADAVISWAACLGDVRFCLLEQHLPEGVEHPFADAMMKHFHKLRTPLRSILQYPQLDDQQSRFLNRQWTSVVVRSLWDLWSDDNLLPMEQRLALNAVEPFDEWEELALFASHYFLLVAANAPNQMKPTVENNYIGAHSSVPSKPYIGPRGDFSASLTLTHRKSEQQATRRFGALYPAHPGILHHQGGLGTQTRLNSANVYYRDDDKLISGDLILPPSVIRARMCHTVTSIDRAKSLLVGGRVSPDQALSDCWIVRNGSWERIEDLPLPLYRHSATSLELGGSTRGVLVYGGKTSGGVTVNLWLLWQESTGWVKVKQCSDSFLGPRFGAAMTSTGAREGILLGGMAEDGTNVAEMWHWSVDDRTTQATITLHLRSIDAGDPPGLRQVICRFGASLCWTSIGLLLVGGFSARVLVPREYEILGLIRGRSQSEDPGGLRWRPFRVDYAAEGPRFLFAGHSTYSDLDSVAIVGGGAVCFSFGTHWNEGIRTLKCGDDSPNQIWRPMEVSARNATNNDDKSYTNKDNVPTHQQSNPPAIPRIRVEEKKDFGNVLNKSQPVIMEGLDIGTCTQAWTLDYLKAKVGKDRLVVVHEAAESHMNFVTKNFRYVTKSFGDFVEELSKGSKQYLRSLAASKPTETPASISVDFPELSPDFCLPPQLEQVAQKAHSSPLRISGPVTMWLHYDVMANVLCQIRGAKRLILYPPRDVKYLGFPAGSSSSSTNVFSVDNDTPSFLAHTHPQVARLEAGDVLFVPPLWLHSAAPQEEVSIAVNVFFRSLESGYAAGRDVYGNRDLQAYEKGRKEVERMAKAFEGLPADVGGFYLDRLAEELRTKARAFDRSDSQ